MAESESFWEPYHEFCYWTTDRQAEHEVIVDSLGRLVRKSCGVALENIDDIYSYVLLPAPPDGGESTGLGRLIVAKEGGHSCLAGGQAVLAAGNLGFLEGTWVWDNISEHYRPGTASLLVLARFLGSFNNGFFVGNGRAMQFRVWARNECVAFREKCTMVFYEFTAEQLERFVVFYYPEILQELSISLAHPHRSSFAFERQQLVLLLHPLPQQST